jgi:hypothetical protein
LYLTSQKEELLLYNLDRNRRSSSGDRRQERRRKNQEGCAAAPPRSLLIYFFGCCFDIIEAERNEKRLCAFTGFIFNLFFYVS